MSEDVSAVKEVREEGDAVIVSLQGDIDLHSAPDVHNALTTASESHPARIIVNCEDVTYMDSSGIGTLVEVFRSSRNYGGTLVLCNVSSRVYNVLEITRLHTIFTIYKTESEAVAG